MAKLTIEEKDDLAEFIYDEQFILISKVLAIHLKTSEERVLKISSAEPDKLQLEKAKLEGMQSLYMYYQNLKGKKKEQK